MKAGKKNSHTASQPEIPQSFIDKMESQIGAEECAQLVAALNESPSVSIRLNRKKVNEPGSFISRFKDYGVTPVEWCDSGFYLDRRPDFAHDPLLHAGAYYVQEAASMIYESVGRQLLPGLKAGIGSCLRVLDLCAAPGGKTTALLNALEGNYILVANEYDRKRAKILKENLDKWGDPNVIITNSNTEAFSRLEDYFDVVAVDAPCSGEGMMRREAVARTQWSTGLVESCAALQRVILNDAAATLKPGGFLIYSTCTFNPEENEQNAAWLENLYGLLPVIAPRRFMPHREKCEGLFVAAFQKPGADLVTGCRGGVESVARDLIKRKINILSVGTELKVKKGETEIPSSRAVLAYDYDRKQFPSVNLSLQEAVSYLRGNPLVLPEDVPQGFVTVCFDGFPLGLVKNIGSRANNLYPREWRLRPH